MASEKIYSFNKIKFISFYSFIFFLPSIFCNQITIKLKGEEKEAYFINQIEERDCPEQIIIDGELIPYKTCKYTFPNKIVTVKLKFEKNINNFYRMFSDLYNIIEIDLSKLNTSLVNNMSYMFENCYSLIFVNLSNLYLSSMINMDNMFTNCISLKSLDFTNLELFKFKNNINSFLNSMNLGKYNILND